MISVLGLLFTSLLLGMAARRSGRFHEHTAHVINAYVINVALPALVLRSVHGLTLAPELLLSAAVPWVIFGAAWLLFHALGPRLGLAPGSVAALVLTGGLGNTSFVGLPLIEGLRGPEALRVAVVIDQLGSFLALATVATLYAARAAQKETHPAALWKKLVGFMPLVALVLALLTHPWVFPTWVDGVLARLGSTLTPLTLFSVGYQLRLSGLRGRGKALGLGLGYKLVLAPLGIALLLLALPRLDRLSYEVTVLQAGMAPMVTGAILAVDHGLDPELSALMVGVGIPLSLLTVPAALWMMG
ncbi:AEC family transporter [Cystobacter fuscus]|uniref:AEC family transporter n=1 Tax=Cystobacter fuscus TaxID=43 RepID=UPI002B2BE673|nr:AEC family transporter [Cystobacter fuscus]